ncbi:MAG: acyloxyacyl hydrolase [Thiohalobacteraceae bacterium]
MQASYGYLVHARRNACGLACLLVAVAPPAPLRAAEPPGGSFQMTPLIGYRSGGSFQDEISGTDLDLDSGGSYGLAVTFDHDANTQWEFLYSHQDSELRLPQPFLGQRQFGLDVDYFSAGGTYLWRNPRAQPFVSAGIGLTHMSPEDAQFDSETRLMLQLAAGYRFVLGKNVGLRIEARGYGTLVDSDTAFFCGNGACIVRVDSSGFTQLEINAGLSLGF